MNDTGKPMFKPRWYMGYGSNGPTGVVQTSQLIRDRRLAPAAYRLPEHILRLAHAEYERQFSGQDYERMQERSGLGIEEVINLLADHLDRLGAEPSTPRRAEAERLLEDKT